MAGKEKPRKLTRQEQVASLNWSDIASGLDTCGYAVIGPLLTPEECHSLTGAYGDKEPYRSTVVMENRGYGSGEYKYFSYPLPPVVEELREILYLFLSGIANRWNEAMSIDVRYPEDHESFKSHCHAAGQVKPTPLILRYETGDYNCLHQDIYGEHVFPLQVAFLLSEPGRDFSGGEFVLTGQRPRMQSSVEVVPLRQGKGVIFPVRERPVRGTRGFYRVNMRHGVSRIRSGERFTMGIIFHDAK
jgi:hypothetical protein